MWEYLCEVVEGVFCMCEDVMYVYMAPLFCSQYARLYPSGFARFFHCSISRRRA